MRILIAYATNSGSTYLVAKYVMERLCDRECEMILKNITDVDPDEIDQYDLVAFGSNSWDFERKEGQPHHFFMKFLQTAQNVNWSGCKFILFGCGDRSYQHFCGALDVINDFVTQHGGQVLAEPLRVDRYYFQDPDEVQKEIDNWVAGLPL